MHSIRPWLAIGAYRATTNVALLRAHGITAMLQLAEDVPQPGIHTLYLPVDDGQPLAPALLERGVAFVRTEQQRGGVVLVACGAGISRSAAFATAALKEVEGHTLLEAFRLIKQAHPDALPHMALWDSLCQYYGEAIPFLTMLQL